MTRKSRPELSKTAEVDGDSSERLLAAASQLLQSKGADGFSLRELATAADVTTMAVYSRFGGRKGLLTALYIEGFTRLTAYEDSIEDRDDPWRWLCSKLAVYRRFALENVGYYRLMFGGGIEFSPINPDNRFASLAVPVDAAYPAYERLVNTVAACQEIGLVRRDRPADTFAHIIWSTLHGLISLEFAGYVQPAVALERFEAATEFLLSALHEQHGQPKPS